jgi:multiple sugar transport system permease protein
MAQTEALEPIPTKAKPKVRTQRSRLQRWLPYLLCLPAFVVPIALILVGMVGNYFSLTNFDLRYGIREYVGFENFIRLLTRDSLFWNSVVVTLKYALLALITELPLGFGISLLLDRITGSLSKVARAIVILPMCVAPVLATLMMKVMMGPQVGLFNFILKLAGLPQVDWFGSTRVVLFSLILIDIWVYTPFVILVFWGGWQTLPKAPYEAASLDGASSWFIFRKLTLPLMKPFMMIALLFRTADSLNAFDTIYSSTKGGPSSASRTLSVLAFDQGLLYFNLAYGIAIVTLLYIIVSFITKRLMQLWPR